LNVKDVPFMVYEKISEEFGIPGEKTVSISSISHSLKIRREKNGFIFAYGEQKQWKPWEKTFFYILWIKKKWEEIEEGECIEDETVFPDARQFLKIEAGSFPAGSWLIGFGQSIREGVTIDLVPNLFIGGSMIEIACEAISLANILTMSPDCKKTFFYEVDKDRYASYENPP